MGFMASDKQGPIGARARIDPQRSADFLPDRGAPGTEDAEAFDDPQTQEAKDRMEAEGPGAKETDRRLTELEAPGRLGEQAAPR